MHKDMLYFAMESTGTGVGSPQSQSPYVYIHALPERLEYAAEMDEQSKIR